MINGIESINGSNSDTGNATDANRKNTLLGTIKLPVFSNHAKDIMANGRTANEKKVKTKTAFDGLCKYHIRMASLYSKPHSGHLWFFGRPVRS